MARPWLQLTCFRSSVIMSYASYNERLVIIMTEVMPPGIFDNVEKIGRDPITPLHTQVRNILRRLIHEHFSDGQKFWTEATLVARLGVSIVTVRRAILDLSG